MKNRLLNVIAIAVITIGIFALSMTGCDNGTNSANNPPLPEPTVITIAAIEGVTVPVTGETPVTTITENDQYTGTVTWNDNPATFAGSTVYTATITLTPKTGYILQGVTENFFTVAGTTSVTNGANSGVITAVFAATKTKFEGSWLNLTAISMGYTDFSFTFTDNNFVFNGQNNSTNNGTFTFTDTTITFIPASGQTWQTFTQGYTLSGNVLNLAQGGVFGFGSFTKNMKQISVPEGTITVALLATGKYCDVYYDINVSQPTELQLRQIVFSFDNGYEKTTSFLGLYERGGGPGGNGGADGIPRIQTYIYDLYLSDGRVLINNKEEDVCIDINSITETVFTHELCHLIYYRNGSASPEIWYNELLPIMSEAIFYDIRIDWSMPNVQLFGTWTNNIGGPNDAVYYNTYRKLAKFLVSKFDNSVFYDLYHESAINKQALENVLRKRGTTLQIVEAEFPDWCDNFGYPNDNEARIIIIDNVTLTGQVGVWLVANLPSGNDAPVNTAIQYGLISNNKIEVSLVVPDNNTWNSGPAWLGSGDYYVFLVPVLNQATQWGNALVYTGGGTTPVTVTFNKAITRLSYTDFKVK